MCFKRHYEEKYRDNRRQYLQIIYLIRELYAEYIKKSYNSIIKKITQLDLTGVAQWAGRHSTNQKVTGSIPW